MAATIFALTSFPGQEESDLVELMEYISLADTIHCNVGCSKLEQTSIASLESAYTMALLRPNQSKPLTFALGARRGRRDATLEVVAVSQVGVADLGITSPGSPALLHQWLSPGLYLGA